MYFRFFKKHSPGRKMYGYGFIINYKTHTLIIGTKKREYRNSKKNYKDFLRLQIFCTLSKYVFIILRYPMVITQKTKRNIQSF